MFGVSPESSQTRDIVVVGASAGGVESLRALAKSLPADLPAAVFVVLHVGRARSQLARILGSAGPLPVATAVDGAPVERGRIYVAAPDLHLLLEPGVMRIWHGPKENRTRPAIDPLFRTAALAYPGRTVGVILSGALDDGVAGMLAIARSGGVTIVQSPEDSLYPALPQNVLQAMEPDHVVPVASIGELLSRATRARIEPRRSATDTIAKREQRAMKGSSPEQLDEVGRPSALTCPECHGVLAEVADGELLRYRCHTGHAYTAQSLLQDQAEAIEDALWSAIRALREHATLSRELARRARGMAFGESAAQFEQRAERDEREAANIESLLETAARGTEPEVAAGR